MGRPAGASAWWHPARMRGRKTARRTRVTCTLPELPDFCNYFSFGEHGMVIVVQNRTYFFYVALRNDFLSGNATCFMSPQISLETIRSEVVLRSVQISTRCTLRMITRKNAR